MVLGRLEYQMGKINSIISRVHHWIQSVRRTPMAIWMGVSILVKA